MSRPRLLDLFCGAGGAARGYHDAGFDIVGVDIVDQPRYPYRFIRSNALTFVRDRNGWGWGGLMIDAIHASPPCQAYSKLAAMHPERSYPDLIPETRRLLVETGLPWIMENVEGAPMSHQPALDGSYGVVLCGSAFGLGVERGELRRHRAFETSFPVTPNGCNHQRQTVGVYGHGGYSGKHRMLYREEASEAMGIDWMSRDEMTQAIPPAYTEYIGTQLLAQIRVVA